MNFILVDCHDSAATGVGIVGSAAVVGVVGPGPGSKAVSTEKSSTGGDRPNAGRAFLKRATCLLWAAVETCGVVLPGT